MVLFLGEGSAKSADRLTRRGFLQAGSLLGIRFSHLELLSLQAKGALSKGDDERACIMIFNVGAPSHIDLFDPKPSAPAEIRGPFRTIATRSKDIQLTELLPLHAKIADQFSLVRGCCHSAPAAHDIGRQLLQTGRLFSTGISAPHIGCALAYLKGAKTPLPAHVILPEPIGATGGNLPHGQPAGFLGEAFDPFSLAGGLDPSANAVELCRQGSSASHPPTNPTVRNAFDLSKEPQSLRERYGMTRFGQCCLLARRLVEAGVRFVTVNTFLTVFNEATWDIHGSYPFTSLAGMKDFVAPMYDQAYSALIEDLRQRGMLQSTLVANLAEFGRTPRINAAGGRDHWTGCWTVYFAGGGVRGGRVIGRSDEIGAYPADRPVSPAEVIATIYKSLGIDLKTTLPGPGGIPVPIVEPGTRELHELF